MLEKIGLPAKPSLRGSAWVVDASHCQGCSSQFTFINRKHHCRRCGGIFCNSCTQKRMFLRGQGDSPVRICEPCKTLEEAARFELRSGNKNRAGRGSSRSISKHDDEVLNQILGNDEDKSNSDLVSRIQRTNTTASCTSSVGEEIQKHPIEENDIEPASPEKLRQQAVDEKKRYKILKGEGKPEEALKAFKRGKELERQADALEISIRKNRRKVLRSGNMPEMQTEDIPQESGRKRAPISHVSKEKDDLLSELKDLGWTDTDLHDGDKKPVVTSIEGEFSSLLGDVYQKPKKDAGTSGIDKTQVVAHKRKALALKRAGNLAEAKEELKKAKILEKELEEQELLGGAEDSDDELSAIIRNMDDDDEQDELIAGQGLGHGSDFDHLLGTVGDLGDDRNLEVTDDDLMDPEMAAQLNSLGWADEFDNQQSNVFQSAPVDRESLLGEIDSLKREAVNRKKAGNTAEAMAMLKKAKLLEREMGSLDGQADNLSTRSSSTIQEGLVSRSIPSKKDSKLAPKNRLMIQKELLGLKKKALALRREGKLDEAEEELKKGRVLEQQLEEIDNASKAKANPVNFDQVEPELEFDKPIHGNIPTGEVEADVTDEDLHDPAYLSLLNNLGWKEEDELPSSVSKSSKEDDNHSIRIVEPPVSQATSSSSLRKSKKSKGELQRELLGLKRKALALRRQGKVDEADELLESAKELETQMAEMDAFSQTEIQVKSNVTKDDSVEFEDKKDDIVGNPIDLLTGDDRNDHRLIPIQANISFDASRLPEAHMEVEPVLSAPENIQTRESIADEKPQTGKTSSAQKLASQNNQSLLQQEILARKRKALAFKREGKLSEAREELRQAKLLEKSLETGVPEIKSSTNNASPPISNVPSPEKEPSRSNLAAKPSTGRDRFKLQQESLSHKRQALKLRREGRTEEAEAEFELAKNLEMQLEEMDSAKSSIGTAGPENDLGVEDFLDPQLLSALKSLGIEDSTSAPKGPEKISPAKGENLVQERIQLEEQIKSEKIKALNLKRSGKQAEALDSLRRAKLYEKKLNSLASA
ncbi:phosphoinositide binding [Euphorbia peplus]|nr:phosphoinositide binding [Euphorbia peplus]